MNKKRLVLLASAIAGLGLIGGTFAAWAVTDNASPFSIKVSPGSIATDTTTHYVTFDWGSSQSIGNVGGLARGAYKKAGVLDLRADTDNSASIYGQLSYSVVNDDNEKDLKQYLKVTVYAGDVDVGVLNAEAFSDEKTYAVNDYVTYSTKTYKCKTAVTSAGAWDSTKWDEVTVPTPISFASEEAAAYSASATYSAGDYAIYDSVLYQCKKAITVAEAWNAKHWNALLDHSTDVQVTDNHETLYSVFVSLKDTVTVPIYTTITTYKASITFDWGYSYAHSQEQLEAITLYSTQVNGKAPYIFAWGDSGTNDEWPGVPMTATSKNGYYTAEISSEYTYVIFTNQNKDAQSGDITIASSFTGGKNLFTWSGSGDLKGEIGTYDPTVETIYYLLGENVYVGDDASDSTKACTWSTDTTASVARVTLTDGVGSINLYTTGSGKMKIYDGALWYGVGDNANYTWNDEGKFTLTFTLNPSDGTTYLTGVARA